MDQFLNAKECEDMHNPMLEPLCNVMVKEEVMDNGNLQQTVDFGTQNKNEFKCNICEKVYTRKNTLTRHLIIHTGERPYACDICGKTFARKIALSEHEFVHKGGRDKPFQCKICNKSFISRGALIAHTRLHTGEKPFACDICNKAFPTKSQLVLHVRGHTGERPFPCALCERTFRDKSDLTKHVRRHTGDKPYSCPHCDKTFATKCQLTGHARTHTGEKPYSCVCGKTYTLKSSLNQHERRRAEHERKTGKPGLHINLVIRLEEGDDESTPDNYHTLLQTSDYVECELGDAIKKEIKEEELSEDDASLDAEAMQETIDQAAKECTDFSYIKEES